MTENEIAAVVVDACIKIHTTLGPGLFENVYEAILARELENRGLQVERQVPIPVTWEELVFDEGCRADLIVEDKLIIELKSVEKNLPVHKKQLNTYLKLSGKKLGLVTNFGMALMKEGIARVVNGLEEDG
ncbi:MAG: GxxExxY protein [Planctomycetes bacterium]|nr:GxxExxY protein [Planctomycetota bacterium]